ncbi:hypothetical protein KM914_21335 [Virgibacillus pantothenticus]|nr:MULTISPECIES: hypothetical protein [Virgibacillus]MBS7429310.1 hypothetical protein [Virgibacillus sp. 19R1-5]MBU8568908.1 hypothetical protein [Virgibacillus pantothenticus]MBU8644782.1 hypothetical protein [Virgibacillus pantothenticus]MBU8648903.1 hypothetical protein [Virgibacillus pantothenticus]MBU8662691.1 hypothetical protein [Virgibacillus pantothenticus]
MNYILAQFLYRMMSDCLTFGKEMVTLSLTIPSSALAATRVVPRVN